MANTSPLNLHRENVLAEWIDYNGHMNVAFYVLAFDHATDALLDYLGMDEAYRDTTQSSVFTLEMHVNYLRELLPADPLRCSTQILDFDAKRIHYFHHMYHAEKGYLAATNELILMHMDMTTRRGNAMPQAVLDQLAVICEAHKSLPLPEQVSSVIGIRRKTARI